MNSASMRGPAPRDRTAATIINSAAAILAERGDAVSMEQIALAAGIGRATLYRHFANREELLGAMARASVAEVAEGIRAARIDAVPYEEAIARLVRAILAAGGKYAYVSRDTLRYESHPPDLEDGVLQPIHALFERAVADGSLRTDLPVDLLMNLLSGLIKGALDTTAGAPRAVEETAAAITAVFVHGTCAA